MAFSPLSNELVSTHGYVGNQIMVWNAHDMERISVLDGHSNRVLHLAVSPDGENVATASADETLKFWKVFPRQDPNSFPETDALEMRLNTIGKDLLQLR